MSRKQSPLSGISFFVRPNEIFEVAELTRFRELAGATDETHYTYIPVMGMGHRKVKTWRIDVKHLQQLLDSPFELGKDYLAFRQMRGTVRAWCISRAWLVAALNPTVIHVPRVAPTRRKVSPQFYDYFLNAVGSYPDTLVEGLKGLGVQCEESDLVELNLGLEQTIRAWPIELDVMLKLSEEQRLNSWRGECFYRRPKDNRRGKARQVDEAFLSALQQYAFEHHARQAVICRGCLTEA